jgi:hypothetical protein
MEKTLIKKMSWIVVSLIVVMTGMLCVNSNLADAKAGYKSGNNSNKVVQNSGNASNPGSTYDVTFRAIILGDTVGDITKTSYLWAKCDQKVQKEVRPNLDGYMTITDLDKDSDYCISQQDRIPGFWGSDGYWRLSLNNDKLVVVYEDQLSTQHVLYTYDKCKDYAVGGCDQIFDVENSQYGQTNDAQFRVNANLSNGTKSTSSSYIISNITTGNGDVDDQIAKVGDPVTLTNGHVYSVTANVSDKGYKFTSSRKVVWAYNGVVLELNDGVSGYEDTHPASETLFSDFHSLNKYNDAWEIYFDEIANSKPDLQDFDLIESVQDIKSQKGLSDAKLELHKVFNEEACKDSSVFSSADDVLQTAYSEEDGSVVFDNLSSGCYIVKEAKAPADYSAKFTAMMYDLKVTTRRGSTISSVDRYNVGEEVTSGIHKYSRINGESAQGKNLVLSKVDAKSRIKANVGVFPNVKEEDGTDSSESNEDNNNYATGVVDNESKEGATNLDDTKSDLTASDTKEAGNSNDEVNSKSSQQKTETTSASSGLANTGFDGGLLAILLGALSLGLAIRAVFKESKSR